MRYDDFENIMNAKKNVIVLDTNVILDLARYSLYTSKNILEIFSECEEQIWIPYQVFKEYSKNYHRVFGELRKRYKNFEKNLLSIIDISEKNLESALNSSHKYKYFGSETLSNEISKKIEELRQVIKSYKDTVGAEYEELTKNSDAIITEIEKFISNLDKNKQIGEKIGFKEQLEIIKEGELRYKYKLPPGFDDEKKDGLEKFGDLFVWKEILKLPNQLKINNIIFITNDEKNDWWDKNKDSNIEMRSELHDEFKENNPNASIVFMTIGMFQKYASRLYDLYEFGVYVDLNRKDEFFIKRVSDTIEENVIDEICSTPDYYLSSLDVGSEGIENVEDIMCSDICIKDVYSDLTDAKVCIIYLLECYIESICYSHDYWGSDDDTKEIIKSPAIEHKFSGSVVVSIERIIEENETKSKLDYLDVDKVYHNFEIIDNNIEQTDVFFHEDMYFDNEFDNEEDSFESGEFTCPKCGKVFKDYSDDMGGFCRKCAIED